MEHKEIKNFLFIRSDRLGEFLLSLPAIKLVRINYPQSKIYLLARKENIKLIKDIYFIDYFLEYKEDIFESYKGAFELSNSILKKENIDCVISLNPKKAFHFASFLAKVPLRVGYDRKWGFCLNRKIKDKKYLEEKHEVEYNIDLVSLVCQNIFVPEIDIAVDEPSTLAFLGSNFSLGKKYVFLHPFTSNPYKKIEEEFWVALTDKVKSRGIENIVIIGSEEEKEESIRLEKILKVKNITGKIDVRNLAALLKHNCCLFVGLDSGPMHLASMLKIPVIGLFRISNPKRWGPFNTESLVIKGNDLDSFIEKLDDIVDFILNKVAVNNR